MQSNIPLLFQGGGGAYKYNDDFYVTKVHGHASERRVLFAGFQKHFLNHIFSFYAAFFACFEILLYLTFVLAWQHYIVQNINFLSKFFTSIAFMHQKDAKVYMF